MGLLPVVNTYPLSNYTFGAKDSMTEKDKSVEERLDRMRINYMKKGMRTSVEGILLVHEHNHPHVILLEIGSTFRKLPGGRLRPGENDTEGLKRKIISKLGVNSPYYQPNWQVGECVGVWWRPNFDKPMYPYCPPHITKPKECKKLFLVHLPEREYFAVPRNLKLLAVPLFELYENHRVHEHNHPHVILLAIGNTFRKLPGGRLKPGEDDIEGLKRKLNSKLGVNLPYSQPNWQVGECVGVWWRPNFEKLMYPYCPPHISQPKECKKLFLVHLPERGFFAVPGNLKLLAVPLFELYENHRVYGPILANVPQQLSRFQINRVRS